MGFGPFYQVLRYHMIWKIVVSKVITAGSMVTRHMKCHVTWLSVDVSLQISEVDWGLMITLDI